MRFITVLLAIWSFLPVLARTVQVPVELNNVTGVDGRLIFFSALPLPAGAVHKVENIRLTNGDGSEAAAQFTVIDHWQDGSLKLVRICGFVRMKPGERRKIFVEYGDRILQSVHSGILVSRSNDRMLIESGVLSAEFALDKFSLPVAVMLNKKRCGGFLPFPSGSGAASFQEEESDPQHVVIQMEKCRVHFYYNEPWIAVEWLKLPALPVSFSQNRNFRASGLRGNWQIFRFDGKDAVLPPPLIGAVPEWYYEKCGILVSGDRGSAFLRRFEDEIIERMKANMSGVPVALLLQGFFRTGDVNFIYAALKRQQERLFRDEAAWLQGFSAGNLRWSTQCDFSVPGVKPVMSTARLSWKLYAMETAAPETMETFLRGGEILSGAFDHPSGRWHAAVKDSGEALEGELLSPADNIYCSAVMFEMEKLTQKKRYGDIGVRAMVRILNDGVTDGVITSRAVFLLLDRVREYVKRHHGAEKDFDIAGFLLEGKAEQKRQVTFFLYPGEKLFVKAAGTGMIRAVCLPDGGQGSLSVTDSSSRQIAARYDGKSCAYYINVPETGCFLSRAGERLNGIRLAEQGECRVSLPLGRKMRVFTIDAPEKFTFDVPAGRRELSFFLRAMKKGERAKLVVISPDRKIYHAGDFNTDGSGTVFASELTVRDVKEGKWTVVLHASGGNIAFGIRNFHGMLER
ncbi:MAG: hypothetical protein IKC89_02705 [Lentisphaeria bacterium]|nr:hypothetical protein [Lentisphaeria bacterium]